MTLYRLNARRFLLLAFPLVLLSYGEAAQTQKKNKYDIRLLQNNYALAFDDLCFHLLLLIRLQVAVS
jgi:predicted transcriptional regulator